MMSSKASSGGATGAAPARDPREDEQIELQDPARTERIEQLRKRFKSGEYGCEAERLASKIVDEHLS
jgi:anti-sigma28 factor (negative regulator of flagellin synthesis)